MKKNIYMLLNDVSTDTSGYPDTELDEAQMRKYRANLKKRIGKKRRNGVCAALAGAACVILAAGLVLSRPVKERMRASADKGKFSISSLVGVGAGLEQLSLHVDQTRRLSEGYVTLNTVAIDEGEILIYSTYVLDDAESAPRLSNGRWGRDYDSPFRSVLGYLCVPILRPTDMNPYYLDWEYEDEPIYVQKMFVNGKEVVCDITADMFADEKGVIQEAVQYNFHTDTLEYPAQVRLELYRYSDDLFTNDAEKAAALPEIGPEATFEFTLSQDMIIEYEKDVALSETVTLPDGQKLELTRFVYSAAGMRFYGKIEPEFDRSEYPIITIQSVEQMGVTGWFDMVPISDTEVIFTPGRSNSIYSLLPEFEEWEIEVAVYQKNKETDEYERKALNQKIQIPLD